jgi:polyhydroxyalkanoate synthesis regulator phasin
MDEIEQLRMHTGLIIFNTEIMDELLKRVVEGELTAEEIDKFIDLIRTAKEKAEKRIKEAISL